MASPFAENDFIDRDLSAPGASGQATPPTALPISPSRRPPTREELEAQVGQNQSRLAELKRAQEELERERAALEEARRRRAEFDAGRTEMLDHLARGIGLLDKAEFNARRDAEQMATTLAAFREAHAAVQAIREESWTQESWNSELTRALTTIENARMEWNAARLKWTILDGAAPTMPGAPDTPAARHPEWLGARSAGDLFRLGLALTWPVAAVLLVGILAIVLLLLRH